jgi:hypothetical protein
MSPALPVEARPRVMLKTRVRVDGDAVRPSGAMRALHGPTHRHAPVVALTPSPVVNHEGFRGPILRATAFSRWSLA